MKLSPHFSLDEFTHSHYAVRHGLTLQPNAQHIENMKRLCEIVLEPLRACFNKPLKITSGFRSFVLNEKIGGSVSSQHCQGEAADITMAGVPNMALAKHIYAALPFDQLILEYPERGGWVHVSLQESNNRRDVLTFTQGRYVKGLIENKTGT